jgi:hypothetical protein
MGLPLTCDITSQGSLLAFSLQKHSVSAFGLVFSRLSSNERFSFSLNHSRRCMIMKEVLLTRPKTKTRSCSGSHLQALKSLGERDRKHHGLVTHDVGHVVASRISGSKPMSSMRSVSSKMRFLICSQSRKIFKRKVIK